MTARRQRHRLPFRRSGRGVRWVGVVGSILFALHLLCCQAHLLAEHHHLPAVGACPVEPAQAGHSASGSDTADHEHAPHPANDHELQAGTQRQFFLLAVDAVPPEGALLLHAPESFRVGTPLRSGGPPPERPPAPALPRAPPVV